MIITDNNDHNHGVEACIDDYEIHRPAPWEITRGCSGR